MNSARRAPRNADLREARSRCELPFGNAPDGRSETNSIITCSLQSKVQGSSGKVTSGPKRERGIVVRQPLAYAAGYHYAISTLLPKSPLEATMTQSGRPTLLLVDDEPDLLYSLQGLLRQKFDLFVAENGEQALEYVRNQPMHVVMSDQRMPGMSGSQLLTEVNRISPATVRILLTGYADIHDVIAALNTGGLFRYLTKPWDLDELMQVLDDASQEYDTRIARTTRSRDIRRFLEDVSVHLQSQPASETVTSLLEQAFRLLAAKESSVR